MQDPDRLAARMSKEAVAHPRRYLVRVSLLAALGYAYVYGVQVALLALVLMFGLSDEIGRSLVLLPLCFPLAILWTRVKKLPRISHDLPDGLELFRSDAPVLFAEVERLWRRLDAEPICGIFITDGHGAGVQRVSSPTPFGAPGDYLVLGLCLMFALDPDEYRWILAHEIAHGSRAVARLPDWVLRAYARWAPVAKGAHSGSSEAARLRGALFRWYPRTLTAAISAHWRSQELRADREAVSVAGVEAAAAALKRSTILDRYADEYHLPRLDQRCEVEPDPPDDVYRTLISGVRHEGGPWEAESWLLDEILEAGGPLDSHPTLPQRLVSMGDPHPLRAPRWHVGEDAACHYLGTHAPRLLRYFELHWRHCKEDGWREDYARAVRSARLEEIQDLSDPANVSLEDHFEVARAIAAASGAEDAMPILQYLVDNGLDVPEARLFLGHLLLDAGEDDGLSHIQAAMAQDPTLVPSGCDLAIEYLGHCHQPERTTWFRRRLGEFEAERANAREERRVEGLCESDTLLSHGLNDRALEPIIAALAAHRSVRNGYLARREVRFLPERPLYVLGVNLTSSEGGGRRRAARRRAVRWLAGGVPFPGDGVVINMAGKHRRIGRTLKELPEARIYVRDR